MTEWRPLQIARVDRRTAALRERALTQLRIAELLDLLASLSDPTEARR